MSEFSVRYRYSIDAFLEESGDYYGSDITLAEFVNLAEKDTRSIQVLIKKGATELKPVVANIKISSVTLVRK